MIWLLFAAMALVVVVALLWPLLRNPPATVARVDYDLTVFRDQLDEVDRDVTRGVLTAAEADAARIEIKRRMLTASRREVAAGGQDSPQTRALLTAGMAVAVPFLALGLYMLVGAPLLQTHPAAQVAGGEHDRDMPDLIVKLEARMKAEPDDPQGWSLLARSYRQTQRYADAAEAYRNLMRLEPDDPDGYAGYGEMTTAAAGGNVTPEAHAVFVHTLELDRTEPRAQFYLGLERSQAGDAKTALAIWRALTAAAPPDASWLPVVRGQMAEVAQQAGIMPMSVTPQHALDVVGKDPAKPVASAPPPAPTQTAAADPTAPSVTALQGRFSPENMAMIQGMVGGLVAKLESNPDDYDGWMLLGRSYTVLKNEDGAAQAYAHAVILKPGETAPKMQLAQLILPGTTPPSPELVKLASDMHKADSNEPLALLILGDAKAKAGDAGGARKFWQDAQAHLPADAPIRAEITRRIGALK